MRKKIAIALAGNANVGKSVLFNHLTGLHQHIGNWPGKTVERAEGTLVHKGYEIDVTDLPGIYSLTAFSIEESLSRDFLVSEKPDAVVNVVDASVLERNLFLTLQLIELDVPLILALNQMDVAKKKGLEIDCARLGGILQIPVVPMTAITGLGIDTLLEKTIEVAEKRKEIKPAEINYGKELEERIGKIKKLLANSIKYPARYTAIKLLEGDEEIRREIAEKYPGALAVIEEHASELESMHGHNTRLLVASERYNQARRITQECVKEVREPRISLSERLDEITTHKVCGYVVMAAVMVAMFYGIFSLGAMLSAAFEDFFYNLKPLYDNVFGSSSASRFVWEGVFEGIFAGIVIAIPYIVPFYIILGILEDSGYLTRIAFLIDPVMHKIGLHGKSFIPMVLGYGCTVPACLGCRIMETYREKFITACLTTLIPCAARTVVIMGLVATYVGIEWALLLYILDLAFIFILGRMAFKVLPGEPMGLIMEMGDYRLPHARTVLQQTWFRLREFIGIAFPLIIAGNLAIKLAEYLDLLKPVSEAMAPIVAGWLGLPAVAGIALVFGILRKELTLIMLATLLGTTQFDLVLTSAQMIVFSLVTMLYIPCIATFAALVKEFGLRKTVYLTVFEIVLAVVAGGIAYRLLVM
ncbi:MAG: ferrous iron transport protein B [Candidatus Altiarchaeota archaeon]|nr:ferrous iron transport protein B [Candidatus Altiarchaeota archaeon]